MTNMNLTDVIKLTPFKDTVKARLIKETESMDEDQKYRLTMICWKAIAENYDLNLAKETDGILDEVYQGKRKYNKNDFQEAKARQDYKFSEKVEKVKTEENLAKVEKQIDSLKTQAVGKL